MRKIYNSVLTDSPLASPFVPKKKEIGPLVVPLIAAGASILGSAMSSMSNSASNKTNWDVANLNADLQRETNAQNAQLMRESNAQNYKMFQEQNAFNLDMWNKQNAYNDPSAQVQRMINAGINPAAMFGNVSEASSLTSAQPAPNQAALNTAPQVNYRQIPFDYQQGGNAVAQAIALKANYELSQSQVNYNNAKAEYEWQSLGARLLQQVNEARYGSVEYYKALHQYRMFMETYDDQKRIINNQADMSDVSLEGMVLDNIAKDLTNQILSVDVLYKKDMSAASYSALLLGNREVLSRIAVNDADAALKAAQKAVQEAQKYGLDISNEQAEMLVDYIVEKADYEAEEANFKAGLAGREFYQGKGSLFPVPSDVDTPKAMYRRGRRWPIRKDKK